MLRSWLSSVYVNTSVMLRSWLSSVYVHTSVMLRSWEKHFQQKPEKYSGACRRKLASAARTESNPERNVCL